MSNITAQIGYWYQDLQTQAQFEVVAIDDAAQTIEVQFIDGALCEYDIDSWSDMFLRRIGEPEDWHDALAMSDAEDTDPDRPFRPRDWESPLDQIEPDVINGIDDLG